MAHFLCHLGCSHFGALLLDFYFTENTKGIVLKKAITNTSDPYNTEKRKSHKKQIETFDYF